MPKIEWGIGWLCEKRFTDKLLLALKPAPKGKRYSIYDEIVPSLAVQVTDRGTKSFKMPKRWPGGSPHPTGRTLGRYPAMTLASARTKARVWLELFDRGIDPKREEERARRAEMEANAATFGAVAEDFFRRKLAGQRQAAKFEADVRRDLLPFWKDRPITELSKRDVVRRVEAVKDRGAPAQAHSTLGYARVIFGWAIARDIYGVEVNPCDRLRPKELIGAKPLRSRVLNDTEIAAVWHCSTDLEYPWSQLFKVLMLTGQRRTEVGHAHWREFDFESRVWIVPTSNPTPRTWSC